MVISFIWIILMRWIAGPMVWLGMVAVVGLLSYGRVGWLSVIVRLDYHFTGSNSGLLLLLYSRSAEKGIQCTRPTFRIHN